MKRHLLRLATIAATALSSLALQPAVAAHAAAPWANGTVFVADQGHRFQPNGALYALAPNGSVSFLASGGITDVATDSAGDVFYTDCSGGAAFEIHAGGGTTSLGSFSCPSSIALDNAGNILIGDFTGGGSLWMVPSGGGSASLVAQASITNMQVDAGGNVWMADGSQYLAVLIGSSLTRIRGTSLDGEMDGMRLDAAGNFFVSTAFLDTAAEIPADLQGSPTTLATAPNYVHGVATDGASTVWVNDASAGNIYKSVSGVQTLAATGFDRLESLGVFPPIAQNTKASSSTALTTSSALTVTTATSVHLTATVSTLGSKAGLVQFDSNSVPLGTAVATSGGVAKLTTRLPAGTDHITATFLGNTSTGASISSELVFTVNQLSSHTVLTTTSPSTTPGDQMVNVTATVTGSHSIIPTGDVTFMAGTRQLGDSTLDGGGVATGSFFLPPGTSKVTAQYSGDAIYKSSKSNMLTFTTTPPYFVSMTNRVTQGPPNGSGAVRFTITVTVKGVTGNGAPTGSLTADSGFSCSPLTPKTGTVMSTSKCTHLVPSGVVETVNINYSGDATYDPGSTSANIDNGGG